MVRFELSVKHSLGMGYPFFQERGAGKPAGEDAHDDSDLAKSDSFVSCQLGGFILVSARLQPKCCSPGDSSKPIRFLTFFSAFSILDLGTPADLAALRTAARAAFTLGSAEPPAAKAWSETVGRGLNLETYTGLRP